MENFLYKILPIKWAHCEKVSKYLYCLTNAEFTENFGIFNKGEQIPVITVDIYNGIVESFESNSTVNITREQSFDFICEPKKVSAKSFILSELKRLSLKFPESKFGYKYDTQHLVFVEPNDLYKNNDEYIIEESNITNNIGNNINYFDNEILFVSDDSLCAFKDFELIVEKGIVVQQN